MSTVMAEALSELMNLPETIEKYVLSSAARPTDGEHPRRIGSGAAAFPADIVDAPMEYTFYMDVPGLSKSDIQVTIEEENTLVIRSNGKRKREDGEEEGCKYIRLERRPVQKVTRKFRLPENADVSAITARCENGVLTVVIKKLPPPPKPKKVEVTIS
ncbi:heat-shock protein [Striga asiatica]|uniref:Heat-shock protein n=1 Tax=Striga asiatica TaxID=4170 RepID=A0A5A7R844_STRAF|nr:heat-shock protein [Striga asiatica]